MELTPTFIGIGAQKCATTWLYDLLELHPSVGLSSVKEIHFFSQYFEYGFQWYHSHFNECQNAASMIGEFSTTYFSDLAAPERIKQAYPDAKLIVMLRDPIERLISNHKHEIRIGHFNGPDFSVEAGIKNNPSYIQQGLYASHLKRWLEYFDKDQIHIVIFDDVKQKPASVERSLYEFLGLEIVENHTLLSKSNSSYVYRFGFVEKLRRGGLNAIKMLNLESFYRSSVKKSGLQKVYRKINRAPSENVIPAMKETTREELRGIFIEEILQFEDLTGLNLQNWK